LPWWLHAGKRDALRVRRPWRGPVARRAIPRIRSTQIIHAVRPAAPRLRRLKAADELAADSVRLDTSQHSSGFSRKAGFAGTGPIQDHYGPGLDRYDLRLAMTEAVKAALSPRNRPEGSAVPSGIARAGKD